MPGKKIKKVLTSSEIVIEYLQGNSPKQKGVKMKTAILEEAVRSVLQIITYGADSVSIKKIDGTIDATHYYGLATYEHSSSLQKLEECDSAFHQLSGELDGIGFYAPAEIRFTINRVKFWRDVDRWLTAIGVMHNGELSEDLDDSHLIALGKTIGELAKAGELKSLISRD